MLDVLPNGFFHMEFTVPRLLPAGTYHLTDAHVTPSLQNDYTGDEPKMHVSPVRKRYCITAVPNSQTAAASTSPPRE